jgi:Fe2+ or Zn2+ uptake regulation protein
MADDLTPGRPLSRAQEDHRLQQAILALLVHEHPAQRCVDEVIRELTDQPQDPMQRDAITNALRRLAAAGLIHRHGAFVFATRAAVRADQLRP